MTTIATMTGDTDDAAEPDTDKPDTDETAAPAARPVRTQTAPAHTDTAHGAQQRSALVPVLATVIGALIIGVFSIAAVGFNVLRSDIANVRTDLDRKITDEIAGVRTDLDRRITDEIAGVRTDVNLLRDQMEAGFAQVERRFAQVDERFAQIDERFIQIDQRFIQIDQRFAQIDTVLLDHTDRLARIEAVHNDHAHTHPQL
ncbi:hypothetical protein [Candidatus Poriferisodalis sp.]|uniref:hypothetical protein n=1 Tax=Candidatus Poriferisodalis sp. TaxID=3101277 RepID=UPI003B022240